MYTMKNKKQSISKYVCVCANTLYLFIFFKIYSRRHLPKPDANLADASRLPKPEANLADAKRFPSPLANFADVNRLPSPLANLSDGKCLSKFKSSELMSSHCSSLCIIGVDPTSVTKWKRNRTVRRLATRMYFVCIVFRDKL